MELKDMICRRKSVRSYTGVPVEAALLEKIEAFAAKIRPLYPEIRVRHAILEKENVKCIFPWTTPQVIAVYSEKKPGYLENVGFMYQQMDLFLQGIGLGVCWLGMGRLRGKPNADADGLEFVMMLAFGHPKGNALRSGVNEFKRKSLAEISDNGDARLESARLAPSSVNSQPWYFTHEGAWIHAHCVQQGFFGAKALGEMNQIDVGIALAHMFAAYPDSFCFERRQGTSSPKGYGYIGSFML